MLREEKTIAMTEGLIDGLPSGNDVLVMPTFAVLEVIETLRRRMPQIVSRKLPAEKVVNLINEKILWFLQKLNHLLEIKKILSPTYTDSVSLYHSKLSNIMARLQSSIVTSSVRGHRFKGLGLKDLEHLYHALQARAEAFITLDAGFEYAVKDKEFSKIKISILRPNGGAGIA